MTSTSVILMVLLGYSPSGATGAAMEVKEYAQPSMKACTDEASKINTLSNRRFKSFNLTAICVTKTKESYK